MNYHSGPCSVTLSTVIVKKIVSPDQIGVKFLRINNKRTDDVNNIQIDIWFILLFGIT